MMIRTLSLIAALFALALPASAANMRTVLGSSGPSDAPSDGEGMRASIVERNDDLKDAVANPYVTDNTVRAMAAAIFDNIPSIEIKIDRSNLRRWDFEPAPDGKDISIDNLLETADKRFYYYNKEVPPPELVSAHRYLHLLRNSEKVGFDQTDRMGPSQMGEYAYNATSKVLGFVTVNKVLQAIAKMVGRAFILPTLFHEADHARVHLTGNADPDAVIEKETSASTTEYWLLQLIDPYGERLVYLRAFIMDEVKNDPTDTKRAALAYLNHLAELNETEGNYEKVREFVIRRGYKDGHKHKAAAHPIRS